MKVKELEALARQVLPTLESGFITKRTINSASVVSNELILSITNHGFIVGDYITTQGIEFRHEATIAEKVRTTATINTVIKNDLTYPYNSTVAFESNEALYDGEFKSVAGIDRNNFQISVSVDAPFPPIETITLVEKDLAFCNNTFLIKSVTDANTIVVDTFMVDTASLTGGEGYNPNKSNIAGTSDIDRSLEAYSKQESSNTWLMIQAGDTQVSRDRKQNIDFSQRNQKGASINIDTEELFTVFAIKSTKDYQDAVQVQDYCRNELRKSILATFMGYKPAQLFNAEYDFINYQGDNVYAYNTSTYIHAYVFACTVKISDCEALNLKSFAIKQIDTNFYKDEDLKASDKIIF